MVSIDKKTIKKILVISLSNIGDVILTFPVIDILRDNFRDACLSVVIGPKAETLLCGNPNIDNLIVYDKHQEVNQKIEWVSQLKKEEFDLVVDLKNTIIPFLISAKHKASIIPPKAEGLHMRDKHLERLRSVFKYDAESTNQYCLFDTDENIKHVDDLLKIGERGVYDFIAIAPGAADHRKRWHEIGFARVADKLINKYRLKIVFVGDQNDREIAYGIEKFLKNDALNICGKMNLIQLAEIFKKSKMVISNDSAPTHLASYVDVPTIALFGETDPLKYGPWGSNCRYLLGKRGLNSISSETIMEQFDILEGKVVFSNG